MKLKANQFYCVAKRKAVTLNPDDIKVRKVKSTRNHVTVHMAYGKDPKSGCKVTKFVNEAMAQKLKGH
jgi:hypothetical protein